MKLSVCSASLPDHDPESAVMVVRQAGYAGIEWRVASNAFDLNREPHFFDNNRCTVPPVLARLESIADLCREADLEIIGLSPYVDAGDVAAVDAAMSLANAIGVGWIRLRAPWREDGALPSQFAQASEFLSSVEELARRHGVRGLIELHQRSICPSATAAYRLISSFDPRHVGVIYDVGNLIVEGYEDHMMAAQLLGDYLGHVHLKNAAYVRPKHGGVWRPRWTALDDGVLNIPELLRALDSVGYDQWLSIEDFSTARPPAETLRFDATLMQRFLQDRPAAPDLRSMQRVSG